MKNHRSIFAATLVLVVALLGPQTAQAQLVSLQLTDKITGGSGTRAGIGEIDLLKDLTGATVADKAASLQAFRAASGAYGTVPSAQTLIFAVDINENASGLETARAQGVAIKTASISATIGGTPRVVSTKYWTETQALVAESGTTSATCATQRQMRYTLLGDSGSSLIAGRKIGSSTFDSTIKFQIDAGTNFATATAVTLNIELLKTDPNGCGDPENFYDATGGFEDLALIQPADARIFDVLVPYSTDTAFRAEAPSAELSPEGETTVNAELTACVGGLDLNGNCVVEGVSTDGGGTTTVTITLDPSSTLIGNLGANGFTIIGYEDNYPDTGDYDFNDAVVAYKILKTTQLDSAGTNTYVTSISGDAYLVARGAGGYTHRWTLSIPVPSGATLKSGATCSTTKGPENADGVRPPVVSPASPCTVRQAAAGEPVLFVGFENTYALMSATNTGATDNPTLDDIPKSSFSFEFTTPVLESDFASLSEPNPYIEILRRLSTDRVPSKDDLSPNTLWVDLSTRNSQNKPFAMKIPSDWQPPIEFVDIGLAYPEFSTFVTSNGANSKDWYMPAKSQSGKVVKWKVSQVTQ